MSTFGTAGISSSESIPAEPLYRELKNGNGKTEEASRADAAKAVKLFIHEERKPEESEDKDLEMDKIEKALETANKAANAFNRRLDFSVHEGTGRNIIRVVDTESDQVIREIPSRKLLDMIGKLQDLMGLVVDEKV